MSKRCQEVISKCSGEDQDHRELQEGLVGFGFAVAADRDPAAVSQPGGGAFDGPAVRCVRVGGLEDAFAAAAYLADGCAGGDLLAGVAPAADPRLDPAFAQRPFELPGVVAAVGAQLTRSDPALGERIEQRQQMPALVLVARRQPHLERPPVPIDG